MYLMFSLGRPDIWPVGDLAVREGFKRIQGLEDRPTAAQLKPWESRIVPIEVRWQCCAGDFVRRSPCERILGF